MSNGLTGWEIPPHAYRENVFTYYASCLYYTALGIFLGLLLDIIGRKIKTQFNLSGFTSLVIQVVFVITVLLILEMYISKRFADNWQTGTPGLLFIVFFLGTQFLLFANFVSVEGQLDSQDFPNVTSLFVCTSQQ